METQDLKLTLAQPRRQYRMVSSVNIVFIIRMANMQSKVINHPALDVDFTYSYILVVGLYLSQC